MLLINYTYIGLFIEEIKFLSDQPQDLIEKSLKERNKGQRLTDRQIFWINDRLKYHIETEEEMIQKYGISASTLKRVVKNSLVPLKINVGQSFQTYSEWCNSDIIMYFIGWFLESTKHPFTWHDIQKYIMDKLEIEMKPHIIRRLLRDKFNKRYKKGSSRPTKLDFKKHSWTNAFFCVKLLSILHSLKMIINVDGCCFSRSTKQNYSWLDKGLSCWLQNIKYTGSISLLSAILSNGTHLSAVYSWTIDAKIFVQFLDSLFNIWTKRRIKIDQHRSS